MVTKTIQYIMLKKFSKQKFFFLFLIVLVTLSVLYVFRHSETYFPSLEESYCYMDGYAYFFIKNPSDNQYEILVKRDGVYLDKQDIGVDYLPKKIKVFASCTPIGENKKCNFEVRVGIFGFNEEIDCNFEEYKCSESKKTYCVFEKNIVWSNLDALLWLKNHAFDSPKVIAWWDYGKELRNIANVTPIISNPSQSYINSIPPSERSFIKEFEPEEKVRDVASFLLATNESEAVCIAKKYNALYAYLDASDLLKIYWINFEIGKTGYALFPLLLEKVSEGEMFYVGGGVNGTLELKDGKWQLVITGLPNSRTETNLKTIYIENGKVVINEPKDSSSEYVAIISSDFKNIFIFTKGLEETLLIKLFLLDGYETKYFTKVYSNDNVKIYSIDLTGCQ